MMRVMIISAVGVLLLTSSASAQLNKLAKAAGLKYFGTAVDDAGLGNAAYLRIARDPDEFGMLTPANGQKWDATEPQQGRFSFGRGDSVANIVKQTGQGLRCHTLVWYSQLPSWVNNFNRAQMERVITTHIQNVVGHYKGQCYAWDVVNEALEDDGRYRQSPMYRAMGIDFLPHSFKAAAAADPSARLYYNDFNIERCCNAKINATIPLVEAIVRAGAPIHGIGMQGHSRVGNSPSKKELMATMARFSAIEGIEELAFTEVDIRHTRDKTPSTPATREEQAKDFMAVVGACLDTPKCVGVTVWDFADQYSWIPSQFPGEGEACLWDRGLNKKPAYTSLVSLLQSAASTRSASEASAAVTPAPVQAIARDSGPITTA